MLAAKYYAPLSTLGADKGFEPTQDPVSKVITYFLVIVQFLVLMVLLFVAFRWGTQKTKKNLVG